MPFQTVFKRYELKYMLTPRQKELVLDVMKPYMELDPYGRTSIRNLYYDTDNYRLIRRSIEKPAYKEKLRVRSYGRAQANSTVFVELKKKYKHIVYKRRLALPEREAMAWLDGTGGCPESSQIAKELTYILAYYETLHPVVFLSYEREAYRSRDGSDFRITFDDTILCRQNDVSLQSDTYGACVLDPGKVLMEVKCSGGMPLWLIRLLSAERIYQTSFSKYGTAYRTMIFPQKKEAAMYA